MKPLFCTLAAMFLSCTLMASPGLAMADNQPPAAIPESLSPEAMNALIKNLEPEQVAALASLMELLGRSAGADALGSAADAPGIGEVIQDLLVGFQARIVSGFQQLPALFVGLGSGVLAIFDGRGLGGSLMFLGMLALLLAIGAGSEWLFKRATASKREAIRGGRPETLVQTLRTLGQRAGLELGGVVAFVLAALVANRLLVSDGSDRALIGAFLLQAVLIVRVVAAMMRFVLAPQRPDLRLVTTDDWTSRYLYRNFVWIAGLIGVAFFFLTLLEMQQIAVGDALRFWVGLVFSIWIILAIWKARSGLTSILMGEEEELTPGLQRMAAWWPWVTIAIIGANWVFLQFVLGSGAQALSPARTALALTLVIVAPFLDTMIRGIAAHLVPPMIGEGPVAEEAHTHTRLSYVRIGRVLLLGVLIIAVGKLWGLSLRNLPDDGFGAAIAANGVGCLLILTIGYLLWEVLNLWVNRQLAKELPSSDEHAEGGEMGHGGGTRIGTILPILHMTLQITIVTLTVLLALGQLGVNITPLLAGAGVFGLAIGFGAQALVKDIVSGVFFLMDDAFRIGEFIDVGGTMGSVEKISIRSLQLRGHTGAVHIIPYGEMSKLTNLSRDWVIMKLRFTVPFDTDLEKVRKIFKKIGQQLMEDPEHSENLLEPFKSQGAGDVTDVGIVVRGKFTAKPGMQFPIRKEIYSRVQQAFEENGIEFARREVRIKMPGLKDEAHLSPEQTAGVAAAASEAVESALAANAAAKA